MMLHHQHRRHPRDPRRYPAWGVPPFGLRRKIFWSLLGSMLVAGLFTEALSLFWTKFHSATGLAQPGRDIAVIAVCAILFLWFASGRLAFRLVRPLNRLVDVVQRFGQGDYSARAGFSPWARDEVTRVGKAVDEMADRIERQMKEERQLLAVVSHELRTPLARIRVLTDLAREGQAASLDSIDREVSDIDYLVSNILARSRLEFGTLTRQPIRLPEAVSEALDRAGLPSAQLLRIEGDRVQEPVSADPTLLHRAIANLIDNAQRHGKGVERVEVRETPGGGDSVAVEVFDRGPGFPSTVPREARFKAFNQDASGGSRGSGLGLGLNLVQRMIHAQGGSVWAENRVDGGARAGFELPFAPPLPD